MGIARDYGLTFRIPDDLKELYLSALKLDLGRVNGDQSWELPIPATFVVGQDGLILYASADPDYTMRPEPTEVLDAL